MLKGTGSIVVGFALAEALGVPAAPRRGRVTRSASTLTTPASADDAWLILTRAGVTIFSARVELGTGVQTALTQIVVEELRLGMTNVKYVQGDTVLTQSAGTVGSKSIQQGGPPMRHAAATAFQALLGDGRELPQVAGQSARGGRRQVHREQGPKPRSPTQSCSGTQTSVLTPSGDRPLVAPANYKIVGTRCARVDIPGKALATLQLRLRPLPARHAARARGPPDGPQLQFAAVTQLARAQAIPGFVAVVQQGNFVGRGRRDRVGRLRGGRACHRHRGAVDRRCRAGAEATLDAELRDPANHYQTFIDFPQRRTTAAFDAALRRAPDRSDRAVLHAVPDARRDGRRRVPWPT